MNALVPLVNRYTAEYKKIAHALPGQHLPWLRKLRAEALDKFSAQGFPSPREEEWKYTNVTAIEKKPFQPAIYSASTTQELTRLQDYFLADTWTLVIIDGRFSAAHSDLQGLPDSVLISSMADALDNHPDCVQPLLGQSVRNEEHGFIHFNNAWFSDGLFLSIPENTVLEKPMHMLNIVTGADTLATSRNIITLAANSEARIIETYVGEQDLAYLNVAISEVFIANNAQLHLYKLQNESTQAFHFGGTYIQQQRDARLHHHSFSFGGLLARNEVHCDLLQAAQCQLNGLYVGVKRQHVDNHTRINHLQPHARSREMYKGVLDQRARGVFQGRVVVHEDAQKTDSEMNNRNLLLSEHAEVDTKPQLEIYADDVLCAHGVTVGQLDDKSVYYLQSRCIDEETARNMLTFAFANEMVEQLDIDNFKQLVLTQLLEHFPQTGIIKGWL